MNKAIHSFLRYRPTEDWITRKSRCTWLKLAIDVPWEQIKQEADALYSKAVLHRAHDKFVNYTHQGWKSLTLHGVNSTTTEDTNDSMSWTDIAELCPITKLFIEKYWIIDNTTRRIRYMWLDPQGYILPHIDREQFGLFESNIAIDHPSGCEFRFLDKGTVPFVTGTGFLVDISNRHMVVNNSNQIRTHIIVRAKLKPGVVKESYEQSFYS